MPIIVFDTFYFMLLTLTITDGPSLPAEDLKTFIEEAGKKGEDPAKAIADLIRSSIAKPLPKRKEVAK